MVASGLLVVVAEVFVSYSTIFRTFKWLTLALFAYVITGILVHPNLMAVLRAGVVPHLEWNRDFVMALVAVFGTTISPYLFFWQASSEVDESVRTSELKAARFDILVGMLLSNVVMYFIILTTAAVLHAHGKTGGQTADQAAQALAPLAGQLAFVLFAAGMIGTGLLAIPILSGSAAYAVKEFFGLPGGGKRVSGRLSLLLTWTATLVMGIAAIALLVSLGVR